MRLQSGVNHQWTLYFVLISLISDAGVPVYLYEFAYSADVHKDKRPSFVRADHADDVGFVFGGCFWDGRIKITGICQHTVVPCETQFQLISMVILFTSPWEIWTVLEWKNFENTFYLANSKHKDKSEPHKIQLAEFIFFLWWKVWVLQANNWFINWCKFLLWVFVMEVIFFCRAFFEMPGTAGLIHQNELMMTCKLFALRKRHWRGWTSLSNHDVILGQFCSNRVRS